MSQHAVHEPQADAAPKLTPAPRRVVQRRCACGSGSAAGACTSCGPGAAFVQRRAPSAAAPMSAPASVQRTLSSPGRPLDAGTRGFMESRFGHDFSRVRIHTDSLAGESARAIQAHAYTAGQHIAFAPGRYRPDSHSGRHLLAHELAHTVQQGGLQRRASDLAVDTAPDSRLEREADAAAHAVLHGAGARPVLASRLPGALVSRAPDTAAATSPAQASARTWTELPADSPLRTEGITARQDGGGGIVAFRVARFPLPQKKGLPRVLDLWKAKAKAQALEATIAFSGSKPDGAALWQSRDRTSQLKSSWLGKLGWSDANALTKWHESGGDKLTGSFKPRVKNKVGHMDHVVELQIGGTNTRENVQVHDAADNTSSGGTIWSYISGLAQKAHHAETAPKPRYVLLHFDDVDWDPGPPSAPAGPAAPGGASACAEVEYTALEKRGPAQPQKPGQDSAGRSTEPYKVESAGNSDVLQVLPKPATTTDLGGDENRSARQLVAGLALTKLTRPRSGAEILEAVVDQTNLLGNSKPTKVPLTLQNTPSAIKFVVKAGKLSLLPGQRPAFDFVYPYLSKGHVTLSYDDADGLVATGTLTPSLPLLNKLPLKVELKRGSLRAYLEEKDSKAATKLRSSIPYVHFTKAELEVDLLPEFKPGGTLEFVIGPSPTKHYAQGAVSITGSSSGLNVEGSLTVHLPRMKPVVGKVWYRNTQWGGEVSISATDIEFPGLKSGSLKAGFDASGMTLSGSVGLSVAGQDLTFSADRSKTGNWLYRADTVFQIPGLQPLKMQLTTDGKGIWGSATAGITYKGVTGNLTAKYGQIPGAERGGWSGSVVATFKRGKATGGITVHISDRGRLYGEGHITYPITDKLVGSVGIELKQSGVIKLKGSLTFADVQIFASKSGKKSFDGIPRVEVPLYGFTLGPVGSIGLVLRIIPTLSADYSVGPGMLKNISLAANATIDPLSEDLNLEFDAGATVSIVVSGGVSLGVEAELALAAVVASISAGAGLKARLGLNGALSSAFAIHYQKAYWTASSDTSLLLTPEISINGYLYVRAEADFKIFKEKAEKRWDVLSKSWGSDLQFGLKKATVGYDSRTGFVFPNADNIEWAYPKDLKLKERISALMGTGPTSQSG